MFLSWWKKIKQHWVAVAVTIAIILVLTLIIICIWFNGTGFNGYTQVSTIRTLSGPTAGTVTRTETNQPGKTLWDWLQLLFIPVVLAIAGFWFNHRERKSAELRADTERKIAQDNQREAALKEYIDKISDLLLHGHIRESEEYSEIRTIARVHTLTVLPRLDSGRKRSLLQFLYESGLIEKDNCIINLLGADLSGANLIRAYLKNASLRGTNLQEADLRGAKLQGADLYNAYLSGAKLNVADLRETDLGYAQLSPTNLYGANLYGATLNVTDLFEVDFGPAILHAARLDGANLSNAKLSRVILTNALLKDAKLVHADLRGAELSYSVLDGADIKEADLSGAWLVKSDLIGANLDGTNLNGAIIAHANFKDATGITNEEIEKQTKSLKGATMPDGSIHP